MNRSPLLLQILILAALALSGCTITFGEPTPTATPIPSATPTPLPSPTPTPVPTIYGTWVALNNYASPYASASSVRRYNPDGSFWSASFYSGTYTEGTFNFTGSGSFDWETDSSDGTTDYRLEASGDVLYTTFTRNEKTYFYYYIRRDGSEPVSVTASSDDEDLDGNVRLIYADPTYDYRLLTDEKRDEAPTFSPDGQRVAFIRYRDTNGDGLADWKDDDTDLYLVDVEGGEPQQLTDIHKWIFSYSWSPDGDRIVLGSRWRCYMVDVATREVSPFLEGESCNFPRWSPDGEWISLWHSPPSDDIYPYLVRPDGSERHALLEDGGEHVGTLLWLADGRLLVGIEKEQYSTVNVDGSSLTFIGDTVELLAANPQSLYDWAEGVVPGVQAMTSSTTPIVPTQPSPPTAIPVDNLLDDSSFEGSVSNWSFNSGGMVDGDAIVSDELARSGERALKINAITYESGKGWPGWETKHPIPISRDQTYTFGAWFNTPNGASVWIECAYLDSEGKSIKTISNGCVAMREAWHGLWKPTYLASFGPDRIPEDAVSVRLALRQCLTHTDGQDTEIYFDDVFFGVLPEGVTFLDLAPQP